MSALKQAFAAPMKRRWKLTVAIPCSFVADVPHLREKTSRIGFLGRALGIFKVDEVEIYADMSGNESASQGRIIAGVLGYMETPQHLRKHLVRMNPDLRFAGILPPLRTPNHPTSRRSSDLKPSEVREGVAVQTNSQVSMVDIGVESLVEVPTRLHRGARVSVRIMRTGSKITAEVVDQSRIDIYWGFRVTLKNLPLGRLIQESKPDVVVATSRLGKRVDMMLEQLRTSIAGASTVLLAFGSPKRGLQEILAQESMNLGAVAGFTVNFVPNQGTQTVRTEEAIYSALAFLNTIEDR
jgi:predicted SPOUT superfamily RNA methylase MTH1